jgi:hypothetical protein
MSQDLIEIGLVEVVIQPVPRQVVDQKGRLVATLG